MYTLLVGILYSDVTVLFHAYSMIYSRYYLPTLKVHIHFRKFSTERKIFRRPHAQYNFFFRKNRTAHAVRRKYSVPWKIFGSVYALKASENTFRGPHAQYDFLFVFLKNHTAHAVCGKFFRSVENILKCIYIRLDISLTQFSAVIVMFVCFCFS